MNTSPKLARVLAALARHGVAAEREGPVWKLRQLGAPESICAEVLLPEDYPLSSKAAAQLLSFANLAHPDGGHVCAARATPDFHAGATVPVGAVVATSPDMVVPAAIGTDINCGMRLHVIELDYERFMADKPALVEALRGDLLLGTRDLPMRRAQLAALYRAGAPAWLEAVAAEPLGRMRLADLDQLEGELERAHELGSFEGSERWLFQAERGLIRDPCLGTPGGGNHFVELQVVERVLDGASAHAWGVREGQLALMVHSGSRAVGVAVGQHWRERARELWPQGLAHPPGGVFSVSGAAADAYMEAMATAANYAAVNRLLLAELVRLRLREHYGALAAPLIWDGPHNLVCRERGLNVHRKGATPARAGEPVLIPGSMGQASYLMVGLGSRAHLESASHGAGRALTRHAARKLDDEAAGLASVECITLHRERLREEAPAAYKAIDPVIDVQVEAGIVAPVARMRPLLTFKA